MAYGVRTSCLQINDKEWKMKKLLIAVFLSTTLMFSGCSTLAVKWTPTNVKNDVAIAAAIAKVSVDHPPTGTRLSQYLKANADCWIALCEYYGIEVPLEMKQ